MLPRYHVIFGFLVSLIFGLATNLSASAIGIIFLSSFLIDFDHYLLYIFKKKDFVFMNAYQWFVKRRKKYLKLSLNEREKYKREIVIFHYAEFWILLLILSIFSNVFLFVLIGIAIHIFLDWLELFYLNEPIYSKVSLIWTLVKNKNKKDFD
jgi:hypothetical protein